MSTTPEEEAQNALDNSADVLKEYILSNGEELYQFLFSNPGTIEEIANLIVMHWNKPMTLAHSVKQQIEVDLDQECGDQARERIYE